MSFLIAKQPIFDREGRRVAFEVFLRKKGEFYEYPKEVPYSRATYIIIEIILEQGIDIISIKYQAGLLSPKICLINKAIESLDPKKLIIDVIEPQIPVGEIVYKQVLNVMDKYIEQGVLFCLDEKYLENEKMAKLLDKIHIISVDVKKLNQELIDIIKGKGKTLLISRIEDEKEYKKVASIGDLFQGMYLESPFILKEFQTAPYLKNTLLKLIALTHTAESPKEIADIIATDVGMTAKILRLVNSAYYSPIKEIKSVEQACAMLGLKNLKNFLLVLAMNDYMSIENPELCRKSLVRAIIAQRIAEIIKPEYESEAYLIGLFSLIGEILNMDKITFLKEIKIKQEIIDGYTGKNIHLRNILNHAIFIEEKFPEVLKAQDPTKNDIVINLEKLTGIDRNTLISIATEAFEKAEYMLKL